MTLAMLLVLINHHKGLTILLIVIIALLFMALPCWSKNCLAPFTIGPDFSLTAADARRPSLLQLD